MTRSSPKRSTVCEGSVATGCLPTSSALRDAFPMPSGIRPTSRAKSSSGAPTITCAWATRNKAGTSKPLVELEYELDDLNGKESALVFTSGYISNETGISTIAKLMPGCLILSDAHNHNSMIEGIRQAKCDKQIFRHNDLGHLEELLKAAGARPKLITFESIYSMDGDVAPINA